MGFNVSQPKVGKEAAGLPSAKETGDLFSLPITVAELCKSLDAESLTHFLNKLLDVSGTKLVMGVVSGVDVDRGGDSQTIFVTDLQGDQTYRFPLWAPKEMLNSFSVEVGTKIVATGRIRAWNNRSSSALRTIGFSFHVGALHVLSDAETNLPPEYLFESAVTKAVFLEQKVKQYEETLRVFSEQLNKLNTDKPK